MEFKKLYKYDEKSKLRVWWMETEGANYRTHSGINDGKIVTSGWKTAKPKNVGKANATTAEEQAELEVASKYEDQLTAGGYHETIEVAEGGNVTYFEPMLAEKYEKYGDKIEFPVWSQPKLDGVRCTISSFGTKSRNGKPFVTVPHIEEALSGFFSSFPDTVIDGELYNHDLRDNFEKIISLVRKTKPTAEDLIESKDSVEFHVYDIYSPSIPNAPFSARYAQIVAYLSSIPYIKIVQTDQPVNQEALDNLYGSYMENGYEGQMIRLDNEYQQKRSKYLLKRKEFQDKEFKINRLEEGEGNWAGAVKRVYFTLEDGEEQKAGIRGSHPFLAKMLEEADEYIGGDVTVRFQNRTTDGKLRFPVAIALYKGKRDI